MKENQVCRAHWARLGVAALAAATLLGAAPASAAGQPATGQTGAFGSLPVQAGSIAPARQIEIQQYEADGAMRQADLTRHARNPFQTTGYWVKAGDNLVIDFDDAGVAPGVPVEVWILHPTDNTQRYHYAQKAKLVKGENRIAVEKDGIVNIAYEHTPTGHPLTVTLREGGRALPHFVLGKHTNAQWQEMLATYADSAYVELVSQHAEITVRASHAKHLKDPSELLRTWDRMVPAVQALYGVGVDKNAPHRLDPRPVRIVDAYNGTRQSSDVIVMEGIRFYTDAAAARMIAADALTRNAWTIWGALGQQYLPAPMMWRGSTYGSDDLGALYLQQWLGQQSRYETQGTWDSLKRYFGGEKRDFNRLAHHTQTAMAWQLHLTFGKQLLADIGTAYRQMAAGGTHLPQDPFNKVGEMQQLFMQQASLQSGYNLLPFFEKWGVSIDPQTRHAIESLQLTPLVEPIWENRDSDIRYDLSKKCDIAGIKAQMEPLPAMDGGYRRDVQIPLQAKPVQCGTAKYLWEQIDGPKTLTIADARSARTTVTVPGGLQDGAFKFKLTVSDQRTGATESAVDTFRVVKRLAAVRGPAKVKAGDTVTLDGRVRDVMGFALTFKWRVLDAAGNEAHSGTGSRGKPWQFVAKAPGQYKVFMTAVATKEGWDNSIEVHAEHQLSVEPGANPERQYPDYREGTSYQAGDVVRGRDNRFYQCRSWPRTAWCGSAARAYEPGKGWAWREAWNLFKR
ncbi:hypothetical protein PATSB16_06260 [Pandoraea thiooxydans]|uniref:Peptidase M60 domain-containing protein n=1 Tax=Pandoraea thiooxydans TaxID=445709 RepID=A0A0G3EM30_9BURK|nr:M60 family metallopeptidase [Pandoraea thiooxydans]AKJ67044.1 hypothetical protein ABW99_01150 [Pandoraea thiooxydans]APR93968.1 hypothetical protein PATSB16_06260 [Pandoraea thiooxydans]